MNLISKPNKKTGISSFSIHNKICKSIRGCKAQNCFKYCYANKALRMYKNTREMYLRNLGATTCKSFISQMDDEIKDLGCLYFRIHVCGEFYSQDYLNKWIEIARLNPEVTFFTYTKNLDLVFSHRPKNFIIHLSNDNNLKEFTENKGRFDGECIIKERRTDTPKGYTQCLNQTQGLKCTRCKLCIKPKTNICFEKH